MSEELRDEILVSDDVIAVTAAMTAARVRRIVPGRRHHRQYYEEYPENEKRDSGRQGFP